jgi:hypothetical protein
MSETVDRQQIVNQLTSIGLILFEMIEGIEEQFPTVARSLNEATEYLIEGIHSLVAEEFFDTRKILTTPRLQVDVSYNEGNELEDLYILQDCLAVIENQLHNEYVLAAARATIRSSIIELVETIRPSRQASETATSPWEYLNPTINSHK